VFSTAKMTGSEGELNVTHYFLLNVFSVKALDISLIIAQGIVRLANSLFYISFTNSIPIIF